MSVIGIILIVLVIAMVVGPIMMFRPSGRDRYLASIRQQAVELGIRVKLIPDLEGHKKTAAYSLSFPSKQNLPRKTWVLLRASYEHDVHFYKDWDWAKGSNKVGENMWADIREFLSELPPCIVGVELAPHSLSLYWSESDWTVNELKAHLDRLKAVIEKGG